MSDMSPAKDGGARQFAREDYPPALKPPRVRQLERGRQTGAKVALNVELQPSIQAIVYERHSVLHRGGIAHIEGGRHDPLQVADTESRLLPGAPPRRYQQIAVHP
jgi:hypothetical protein